MLWGRRGLAAAGALALSLLLALALLGWAGAEEGSCEGGVCPGKDPLELGWADAEDIEEMDVDELVAELQGHVSRLKTRHRNREIPEDVYKKKRKKVKRHYRKLFVLKGADQALIDRLGGGGSKKKGGGGGKGVERVGQCVFEKGVDYPGGTCDQTKCTGSDIRFQREVAGPEECCELCRKEHKCELWTYAPEGGRGAGKICWLKTAEARSSRVVNERSKGLISGYLVQEEGAEEAGGGGGGEPKEEETEKEGREEGDGGGGEGEEERERREEEARAEAARAEAERKEKEEEVKRTFEAMKKKGQEQAAQRKEREDQEKKAEEMRREQEEAARKREAKEQGGSAGVSEGGKGTVGSTGGEVGEAGPTLSRSMVGGMWDYLFGSSSSTKEADQQTQKEETAGMKRGEGGGGGQEGKKKKEAKERQEEGEAEMTQEEKEEQRARDKRWEVEAEERRKEWARVKVEEDKDRKKRYSEMEKKRKTKKSIPREAMAKANELSEKSEQAKQQGNMAGAEKLLKDSLHQNPNHGLTLLRYALLLEKTRRQVDAAREYEKALEAGNPALINRERLVAQNNLGLMYKDHMNRHDKAEVVWKDAIADMERANVNNFYFPYRNLGQMFEKNSRTYEAIPLFQKTAKIKQDDGLRMYGDLLLPYVYEDEDDVTAWRERFKANVKRLAKQKLVIHNPIDMDGVPQYYLSYHGRNDAKINARISRGFRKMAPSASFVAPHTKKYKPPPPGKKIKVGFVSYYFREHSVIKMTLGMFKALDYSKFEVVIFQIGNVDDKTKMLERYTGKLITLGGINFQAMRQRIADEQLDVIVYAEIGMDPHSYALAHGRQAPVQLAMHGHASTSGIDSIDYYVTYDFFSEPDAQSHYSEKLIELKGLTPLTLYYDLVPFKLPPHMKDKQGVREWRKRFGIPTDKTVYACTQTLFKVSHELDSVVKRILDGDEKAVVLLKELPMTDQVGKLVIKRMRKTLTPEHFARIVFLPPLSDQDYTNMYGAVDVVLDSFPFGGHTSTMDALSIGRPVVTLPTKFMSGRCTQGFYNRMGIQGLVAGSVDEYVAIALRLGTDKAYRKSVRKQIKENMPKLTQDLRSTRSWEAMLEKLVRGSKEDVDALLWVSRHPEG